MSKQSFPFPLLLIALLAGTQAAAAKVQDSPICAPRSAGGIRPVEQRFADRGVDQRQWQHLDDHGEPAEWLKLPRRSRRRMG